MKEGVMTESPDGMGATNRYSQHARRALSQARLLAQDYHHDAVDTDHLLVGILRECSSLGAQALVDLNASLRRAELEVRVLHAVGDWLETPLDSTTGLRRVLAMAVEESGWFGHHYVGTEHLLLALIRSGEGRAPDLLRTLGISPEQIRRRVRLLLNEGVTEVSIEAAKRTARLSELSRRVLNAAEHLATQVHAPHVGIEHILFVMTQERRSVVSRILSEAELDQASLQHAIENVFAKDGGGEPSALDEVIDEAVDRADQLGTHYTGTDHILLAIAQSERGMHLLRQYGADPDAIIQALHRHLMSSPG
jgi:ATP-dependent Clp protease ATP-binding subunit ClpA